MVRRKTEPPLQLFVLCIGKESEDQSVFRLGLSDCFATSLEQRRRITGVG